ncbi:hypothetical protein [Billgrantia endophytica]|uniref:Permease n=1 Tax=Billgrantia endophytica TaxID=2033802 RepID=A0A2N7TVS6_9GAMM|nr:hypothetical protein [Halomonas endophytica]PMR72294.1 hypothetical protein C1H69_21825 [Halomonas endophytica]
MSAKLETVATQRSARPSLARMMGLVLLLLWPLELLRMLIDQLWLNNASGWLFVLYLLLAFMIAGAGNRVLTSVLLLGIVGLVVADEAWHLAVKGVQASLVFAAFIPTVFLLRNAMAGDRRLIDYRERLERIGPNCQAGMMLVGAHMLGSALTVGALAVLSPVLPQDADAARRRTAASVTMFGISLSMLWSPVFVAMAVVSEFMPHVPLWQPILVGFILGSIGIIMALTFLRMPNKFVLVGRSIYALRAIIPWVVTVAVVVVLVRTFSALSTLEAASLTLLPLVAGILVAQAPDVRQQALRHTRERLDRLGTEISIVAWAFALGTVMRGSTTVELLVQGLFGPETAVLLLVMIIVAGMLITVVIGGHPIVAASIMLAVFGSAETWLTDIVLCGAVLLGWACSSMIGPATLIVIVASGMYRVERSSLILSSNTLLNLFFALIGVLFLTALNKVIT